MTKANQEIVIRFAGHDFIMRGEYEHMKTIQSAVTALEAQPELMTDIFNLSSESNEFYRFENSGLTIQGERHFIMAVASQIIANSKLVTNMSAVMHDILYDIRYAFDFDGIRSKSNTPDAINPNFAQKYRIPAYQAQHCKIYQFIEHALVIKGEAHNIIELATTLRSVERNGGELSGTLSDLVYQIEYAFDIDGIRKADTDIPYDPDFADQYLV